MSDRERVYAWAAIPEGLTAPDRSYILRRILRERDGAPAPERRSFLRSSSARVEGENRRAELIFWTGVPANFDHVRAAEHGVELLTKPSVASEPDLPDGPEWAATGGLSIDEALDEIIRLADERGVSLDEAAERVQPLLDEEAQREALEAGIRAREEHLDAADDLISSAAGEAGADG